MASSNDHLVRPGPLDPGLDELDPDDGPSRDATAFRGIVAASEQVVTAEAELRRAVEVARAAGDSWTIIGAALGTSRQAAQQRFGRARV